MTHPSDVQVQPACWGRLAKLAQHCAQGQMVPSPCQSVCVMHPATTWCEGCMRTLDEIANWSRMDRSAKLMVWSQLSERLAQRISLEQA